MTQEQLQARIDKMRFTYLGSEELERLKNVLTSLNSADDTIWGGITGSIGDQTDLISGGKILASLLPAIAITDTFVESSEAAMLALTAETGDICVRTDETKTYILKGTDPTVLADWELLLTPTGGVVSVFGRSGAVTAQSGDYSFSLISGTASPTQGGTGLTTYVKGDVLIATGTNTVGVVSASATDGYVFTWDAASGLPMWKVASGGGGTPAGSNTQIQYNNSGTFGASSNLTFAANTLTVNGIVSTPNNTTNSTLRAGGLELQCYSVNNCWFGDNIYYNGSKFIRRSTGYGSYYYMNGREGQWRFASNDVAGSQVNEGVGGFGKVVFKLNLDGTVAFGGSMSNVYGTYSGASLISFGTSGNVSIGSPTDISSAILQLTSISKGFLPPRMITTQVAAIASPVDGLLAHDTTLHSLKLYTTGWNNVVHSNIANVKVTSGAPFTNDGYIVVTIGGVDYKLMTTT